MASNKLPTTPANLARAPTTLTTSTEDLEKGSQISRDVPVSSSLARRICRLVRAWSPSEETLYNCVLGTSDGLTVPFAVTASLAGIADAKLVMMAGLAELIAGAISMAAGGVLGARSEVQKHQAVQSALESVMFRPTPPSLAIAECPETAKTIDEETVHALIHTTFATYLPATLIDEMTKSVCNQSATHTLTPAQQIAFLLHFTDPLQTLTTIKAAASTHSPAEPIPYQPPTTSGAWKVAFVLALGYLTGLVPLIPYIVVPREAVERAFWISVAVTVIILAIFGYGKTALTLRVGGIGGAVRRRTWLCVRGALECLFVVGLSAGVSVLVIRGIGGTL